MEDAKHALSCQSAQQLVELREAGICLPGFFLTGRQLTLRVTPHITNQWTPEKIMEILNQGTKHRLYADQCLLFIKQYVPAHSCYTSLNRHSFPKSEGNQCFQLC